MYTFVFPDPEGYRVYNRRLKHLSSREHPPCNSICTHMCCILVSVLLSLAVNSMIGQCWPLWKALNQQLMCTRVFYSVCVRVVAEHCSVQYNAAYK